MKPLRGRLTALQRGRSFISPAKTIANSERYENTGYNIFTILGSFICFFYDHIEDSTRIHTILHVSQALSRCIRILTLQLLLQKSFGKVTIQIDRVVMLGSVAGEYTLLPESKSGPNRNLEIEFQWSNK